MTKSNLHSKFINDLALTFKFCNNLYSQLSLKLPTE